MHRPFHLSGMDILPLDGERPLLHLSLAFAALALSLGLMWVAFSCFLVYMHIFKMCFILGMVGFSMRLHSTHEHALCKGLRRPQKMKTQRYCQMLSI